MFLSKPFGIQREKYYSKRQRKAWKKNAREKQKATKW